MNKRRRNNEVGIRLKSIFSTNKVKLDEEGDNVKHERSVLEFLDSIENDTSALDVFLKEA